MWLDFATGSISGSQFWIIDGYIPDFVECWTFESGSSINFSTFHSIEKLGVLGVKYKLKGLRMNVYYTFWRVKPLDNERRWRRFEPSECFLVFYVLIR